MHNFFSLLPLFAIINPQSSLLTYSANDNLNNLIRETACVILHTGEVTWRAPAILMSACKMNPTFFPFDIQNCDLKFGSWTHTGVQLNLTIDEEEGVTGAKTSFATNGEWDLLEMPLKRELDYSTGIPYPTVTYDIVLERRSLFYMCNLVVPCIIIAGIVLQVGQKQTSQNYVSYNVYLPFYLCPKCDFLLYAWVLLDTFPINNLPDQLIRLAILNSTLTTKTIFSSSNDTVKIRWVVDTGDWYKNNTTNALYILCYSCILQSFYLPAEACEKVALTITILLSLTVFLLLVADTMPPTSEVLPYLSRYHCQKNENINKSCSTCISYWNCLMRVRRMLKMCVITADIVFELSYKGPLDFENVRYYNRSSLPDRSSLPANSKTGMDCLIFGGYSIS